MTLLQYKLKRTRKSITKNGLILRAEEVGAQIKHAEDLIQKWQDNNFCEDLQKAHNEKWEKRIDLSEEIYGSDGSKWYAWDWSRENATTPELQQQEKDEQRATRGRKYKGYVGATAMKRLYRVDFIFVHNGRDEDDNPSEEYVVEMTREYYRKDNIPIPAVDVEIPKGFHKDYLPYGNEHDETIHDILYGPDTIVVDGIRYKRMD